MICPAWLPLQCFEKLNAESPHTRIEYIESVIAGTNEALLAGRVELAITVQIPQGFTGALLMPARMIPVAHPGHPLHKLGRPLTMRDLRAHPQLVGRVDGAHHNTPVLAPVP